MLLLSHFATEMVKVRRTLRLGQRAIDVRSGPKCSLAPHAGAWQHRQLFDACFQPPRSCTGSRGCPHRDTHRLNWLSILAMLAGTFDCPGGVFDLWKIVPAFAEVCARQAEH